ncbi:inositol-pentakisphosphate 2-kinase isoform X2 [Myxocyprinus asiaticus]|uniref:inositol-pentakisphosphate 2-kinase isoform X2 n=1 Tax=Myxocyprinus asiaticus TaxID=70543 RepID=UPI002221F877|nr:inositol-pentakisphosphate 2-kinase isoform X2 [Myxocyprinus asiaticus]
MELDKMDENDWKYHGEGNKSLVVSHSQTAEQAFRHILNIVDYSKYVMKPLLGEKYVHSGEVVKLPLDFVRQLSLKVQQERPELRCDKVMDTFSGCGLCLPNLTQLHHLTDHRPPICVEIKPKCGFLPCSRHITKECKRKVCRFCMHQHFKLANGKWKRLSRYCPLDLFSGSKQRMYVAMKNLLEEPQNNLKIFKGGELIFSCKDDAKQQPDMNDLIQHLWPYFPHSNGLYNGHQPGKAILNEFIQVICSALLSSGDSNRSVEPRKMHLSESIPHCEASPFPRDLLRNGNHGLPKDSVLAKILQVQMLDNLDIEGVNPLYKRVEQYLEEFPKERNRLQIDGPYNESLMDKVKNCPTEDDGSVEYAVGKVHQYRVAMTAKDCSVMITFAPCGEDEEHQPNMDIQPAKPRFTYSVSILDLDPKPYEGIPHQYKLDTKIVNYYLRSTQVPPPSSLYKERQECTLLFHAV